jgi:hypothetical protein
MISKVKVQMEHLLWVSPEPCLQCRTPVPNAPKEAKRIATNPPRVHDPLVSKHPTEKLSNAHWAFWFCQWLCHPIQNALQLKSKRHHQQTFHHV